MADEEQKEQELLKGTVVEKLDVTPDTIMLRVHVPDAEYQAGQFFMLGLPENKNQEGKLIKKAFSVATCCQKHYPDYIEFCIKINGDGTLSPKLKTLKVGQTILLDGPHGKFTLDDSVKEDLVFIAGGTGVAPMMGFLRHALNKELKNNIYLFYSAKTKEDMLYRHELQMIAQGEENINVVFIATQEEDRLTMEKLKEHVSTFDNKLFFLCGPPEKVKDIKKGLQEQGIDATRIKMDAW